MDRLEQLKMEEKELEIELGNMIRSRNYYSRIGNNSKADYFNTGVGVFSNSLTDIRSEILYILSNGRIKSI